MRKRIITLSFALFALVAANNVSAAVTTQQNDGIERPGKATKERPADEAFKFDVEEITFDVTGDAELVLPKLQNPHNLKAPDGGNGIFIDNSAAFLEFETSETPFEIKSYKPNRGYIGDVTLYAQAQKSSKYAASEAKCVIHFVDPSIFKTDNFTAKTMEDQANNVGESCGWLADSNDQPCWYICSPGLWAYGAWAGASSYIEKYMISPAMELEAGNYQYQIQLVYSLYDCGDHPDWVGAVVREAGTTEWTDLAPITIPDAEHKYQQISSDKLNVPVELTGKKVEFGLKYCTDGVTLPNWTIPEIRYSRVDADLTGIKNAEVKNAVNDNKIYDLQGRLVKNPSHGLYIMNGRKFIVK